VLTRAIHDRMPLVLDKADIESWLNGAGGAELLRRLLMIAFAQQRKRSSDNARRTFKSTVNRSSNEPGIKCAGLLLLSQRG